MIGYHGPKVLNSWYRLASSGEEQEEGLTWAVHESDVAAGLGFGFLYKLE